MRVYWFSLFILCGTMVVAQQKAVTDSGEEVILYADGTWRYLNDSARVEEEIPLNPKTFTRSPGNSFLVKSTRFNVGTWVNPKKWSFKKATGNEAAEFEYDFKDGDLYAMIITEGLEIPVETLRNIALQNAREAAPDIHIVSQEYRMVNGLKVLCMQMDGTLQGIKFSYVGYYYSNAKGTLQFLSYTSQALLPKYKADIEELLNGLVQLDQ